MKLFIKNMVCIRCKMVVKAELDKLNIIHKDLVLGEVDLLHSISHDQLEVLDAGLKTYGLELITDNRAKIVEKIKNTIVELIHYSDEELKINYSAFLSEKLKYDYTYLSNLFSEVHGTTIEHFIIHQKIERVKELLVYNEINLSEIAWKLHYSSVQHLSTQFKQVTGLTPTFFKNLSIQRTKEANNQ